MADTDSRRSYDVAATQHDSIGGEIKVEDASSRGHDTDIESNQSWYHREFLDVHAGRKFWKVASELTGSLWEEHFKSFEVLNLALLQRSQQQLILMNRKILESNGELLQRDNVVVEARLALRDYYNDLLRMRELHDLRVECPGKPHGHPNKPEGHPNRQLWEEPTAYWDGQKIWNHYEDSDVAYLSPDPTRTKSDAVRWWFHHLWKKAWLDDIALQQRMQHMLFKDEYSKAIRTDPRWQPWSLHLLQDWNLLLCCIWFRLVLMPLDYLASFDHSSRRLIRPDDSQLQDLRHKLRVLGNRFHVCQSVDFYSRWAIAVISAVSTIQQSSLPSSEPDYLPAELTTAVTLSLEAGAAVLLMNVPLIVLKAIQDEIWTQLTVFAFTLAFASTAAIFSRASNQEILGAIAAYVAVLVVFVSDPRSANKNV